ncbi:MAG TPA: DMT family transporter [Planctomycetota bacterium]|nr:DMT family transporter [Planctomycetota bacterium]
MDDTPKSSGDLRKGFLYALSGSTLISVYFITGKYCLMGFNPETFCLVWISVTAFYAFLLVVVRGRVRELRAPRKARLSLLGVGVSTGVGLVLLYSGLKRIDPTFTAFIARSHPVMVILLGVIFLKERLRAVELLPLVLMLAGGVIGVWGRPRDVNVGVALASLGYVAFAFHRLFVKTASVHVRAEITVFYRAALAWVLIVVWTVATGRADFNVPGKYWLVAFVGALISPVLGNLLSFHAYRYYNLSQSALVLMIQPLLVLPIAYVFLGMLPSRQGLLGGLLILVGAFAVVWIHFSTSRKPVDLEGP